SNVASRYVRERVAAKGNEWRVTSGGIGWNQPAPTPASGLKLALATDSLDADAWLALKKDLAGKDAAAAGNGAAAGNRLGNSDVTQYLEP
ncbi:hypothetical protein ABTF07_19505, partial [Acinetobacter baumannii]